METATADIKNGIAAPAAAAEVSEAGLTVTVCGAFEEFRALEAEWDALLGKSGTPYVCMTHEWYRSWWEGFGKGKQLLIFVVRSRGGVIGIAPLMRHAARYRGLPVREVGFIQNENTPRSDFIVSERPEEVVGAVIGCLKAMENEWDVLSFVNMPEESPHYSVLVRVLRKERMLFGCRPGLRSPYLSVTGSWESYFGARSRKFRKVLRNKVNRIEKAGGYCVEMHEGPADVDGLMETMARISRKSWKGDCGEEIVKDAETEEFVRRLSLAAGGRGWLNVWILKLEGRPVAYEYHLNYRGRVTALRADFDEEYGDKSPGSFLDLQVVKSMFDRGIGEYDMCGSDDFYKRNWTDNTREHAKTVVFGKGAYGRVLYVYDFKVIETLKRLRNRVLRSGGK